MASIIKRRGPRGFTVWQAQVRRRGYPASIRTFDTRPAALAWARQIEAELDRGIFISHAGAGITLHEALSRYAEALALILSVGGKPNG